MSEKPVPVQVPCSHHTISIDHTLTLDQLVLKAVEDEGEALLVEQFARDLPTSHKVEDVAFVLLRTGEVSVYFRESGHVQEMFVRSNLRTPTPREALTFAATLPGLLDKHEIHVIGSDERLNEHLMMFHDGERRALFSYIWGGVPIIARNACFLAVSTQQ